jgi:membrane-bound lytic murein transglycosylase D
MLLPVNRAKQFASNMEKWDKPLLSWTVYTPSNRESVSNIAHRTGMSSSELQAVNQLRSPTLQPGQPVLVAMRNDKNNSGQAVMRSDTPDTTIQIADAVNNTEQPNVLAQLVQQATPPDSGNHNLVATPVRLAANDKSSLPQPVNNPIVKVAMAIPAPVQQMAQAVATQHTVVAGDTLFNISRRYNISVISLRVLNGLGNNSVKVGQVLQLKAPDDGADQHNTSSTDNQNLTGKPVSTEYVVQQGDTLYSIARRFGVDRGQLLNMNQNSEMTRLHPGQVVIVQGL